MIPENELITRIFVSALIGLLIGLERELRRAPAGLRTHILVAVGSTLFTLGSLTIGGDADISRIASQVAVGIGFIGGGVIYKHKDEVKGLTTAANLWVVAALGLLVGIGQYPLAFAGTTVVLIALIGGLIFERKSLRTKW